MNPTIFSSVINSYLPEPHAALLNGIIFGLNLSSTPKFYQQLKIVGLLHMVVLSGMNIAILGAVVGSIIPFVSKRISCLITILIIIFFIYFVGAQAPIIRAGFMGILTLVAVIYGRQVTAIYLLLLSAIFIGIFWPSWLKSLSFYLSYGATLGMIIFGNKEPYKGSNYINSVVYNLKKELKTTLAAQIFTVPMIFIYFHQLSLISPIANVLISFLIPPLMVFGFLTAFLGKINFYLGLPFSYICYGILTYIIWIIEKLSEMPFIFIQF
ncbi:hypothetical protein A3C23_00410 [Candidatus Roizmanbacteria bacterium RIFCSPHIGHO2_02_FULL_37_13b]|uniref:ComEC/Rec2-related protein domain-containing protein n=1 Tax=Candidatus Roizmanbacteria bacterium RIFCSPLOWO2_02_FULL_36_11 TaxID=1802071 RepID=A0A1F7JBS5_9BACT|nr:MAG: hypothetical protein A3C23_00410 [Candidatus Roizmanbacteria bacterium RIFCSPHIGHO2_02_FULL_37_13b]OGK53069.1 MAG: hypothetical protein A3H78_00075 [Candidatus Roizmanbacteria bacterium RIFCSPLOWO2_02_FULL_36_11]